MGEDQGTLFEPEFNRSIKVETFDQRLTSHAGAILLREFDHQLVRWSSDFSLPLD